MRGGESSITSRRAKAPGTPGPSVITFPRGHSPPRDLGTHLGGPARRRTRLQPSPPRLAHCVERLVPGPAERRLR